MAKSILSNLILEGEILPHKLVKRVQLCEDRVEIILALQRTQEKAYKSLVITQDELSEDLQFIKDHVSVGAYSRHFAELEKLCGTKMP